MSVHTYRVDELDIEATAAGPVAHARLVRYPNPGAQLATVWVKLTGPQVDTIQDAYWRRREIAIDDDTLLPPARREDSQP